MIIKKNDLYVFKETGEICDDRFTNLVKDDYIKAGVKWVEPMTAKEYLNEEELEEMLTSSKYIAEEKLDGTRGTFHMFSDCSRVFSRRISKKSEWFCENTDSLPHLKVLSIPELSGTILDGELRVDGKDFKEVSSTLNCTWDKAIERQIELGFITLHAFDIIYYKGIYLGKMPLHRRKVYLEKVVKKINSPYVKSEPYTTDTIIKFISSKDPCVKLQQYNYRDFNNTYPNLCEATGKYALVTLQRGVNVELNKKAWYEFIIANGGEGIMLKDINGRYYHKRGREYTKYKKFITRDCIITGFSEPTKEYKGKEPESWEYWEDYEGDTYTSKPKHWNDSEFAPISKFYAMGWVGNMKFGIVVTDLEIKKWEKENKTKAPITILEDVGGFKHKILEVGECSGFDEEQREEFTKHKKSYVGQVVEILANEIFTKTGKLRHPRFLRIRLDKNAEQCTWKDHIGG